jgi:hypothetical protein
MPLISKPPGEALWMEAPAEKVLKPPRERVRSGWSLQMRSGMRVAFRPDCGTGVWGRASIGGQSVRIALGIQGVEWRDSIFVVCERWFQESGKNYFGGICKETSFSGSL